MNQLLAKTYNGGNTMLTVEEVTKKVKQASINDLYLGLKLLEQFRSTNTEHLTTEEIKIGLTA